MRINQSMAKEVAIKMTEKMALEVKSIYAEYKQFAYDEYIKQTPKLILEAFEKHPEWMETTRQVSIEGAGFSNERIAVDKDIVTNNSYSYGKLNMDNKLAVKMKGYQNKYLTAQAKHKHLKAKIETALNGLRTFAQVEKHLPEALPFLPKSSSMELVVNFDKLREEIKAA